MSKNEPTHRFTLRELTKILIREKGIKQGRWILNAEFGLSAINAGPDDNNISPSALVPLKSLGLSEITDDRKNNLIVDAENIDEE